MKIYLLGFMGAGKSYWGKQLADHWQLPYYDLDEVIVEAEEMAIADIFEALTAKDRPYKKGKTLSESLQILGGFKERNHIDPDLFDVFVREKVYLEYARQFMDPAQIDEVDVSKIPGYAP